MLKSIPCFLFRIIFVDPVPESTHFLLALYMIYINHTVSSCFPFKISVWLQPSRALQMKDLTKISTFYNSCTWYNLTIYSSYLKMFAIIPSSSSKK